MREKVTDGRDVAECHYIQTLACQGLIESYDLTLDPTTIAAAMAR